MEDFGKIKPIGGYFEWEFPPQKPLTLHPDSILLNSGRHALEYILLGLGNVKRLYIPYFTCNVVLQPLERLKIPYTFCRVNESLEFANDIQLANGEYLLYTNYYGVKDAYVREVAELYGERVIIDNAQALFCPAYAHHQFYSPRKFLGMPDGGMAVSKVADNSYTLPKDKSFDRCTHLLKRHELVPSEGYSDFKDISHSIADAPLARMSNISKKILQSVDLDYIKQRRLANFNQLHEALARTNRLETLLTRSLSDFISCPLVYPYFSDNDNLKGKLIANQVFVATYWPNVFEWVKESDLEYQIAQRVVCIPIDQRYDENDISRMIELIKKLK